jgi:cell division septum initiation protein DivIVA
MSLITSDGVRNTRLRTVRRFGWFGADLYDADEVDALLDDQVIPTLEAHESGLIERFERNGK